MSTNGFILGLGIGLLVVLGSGVWFDGRMDLQHEREVLMHKVMLEKAREIAALKEGLVEEREATRFWMGWSENCADQDERDRKYQERFDSMLALCRESVREYGCEI